MEQTDKTQTFTLKSYDYKRGMPIYKASIVDLTLVAMHSLSNIDVTTKFGAEFYKLAGQQISDFFNLICQMYESCSISDPHSTDYRTSYSFWFSETPLKRRVKYAELHLDSATHKLNVLLNVLIIQLRSKYESLKKIHVSSLYSEILMAELEKLLNFLPEPMQKEIVITDRKEAGENAESLPIKTIMITYEPFIEHVNASFNEASKLKRLHNEENENKKTKANEFKNRSKRESPKEELEPESKKSKVPKNEVDEDGFMMIRNKRK